MVLKYITETIEENPGRTLLFFSVIIFILFVTTLVYAFKQCPPCPECPQCEICDMKYKKWPEYEADRAFSIQLKGTKSCLQPKGSDRTPVNNTNLVLNNGCDEDRLRFKVKPDGQIQHYKPFNKNNDRDKSEICLHTKAGGIDGDEIIYMDTCDDNKPGQVNSLRYTFENGKIKNNKSGLCLNTDNIGADSIIKLKDCKNASQFELI